MQYELVWLMRKINNVFLVSQTYSRQCPPLLICMHNLVIVLYVTTMTTSNAFGGNTKRKHYNMAKTNNAKCILFVGSSTTASLILTWNERSFSIEKNIWHFLMRFLGGIFRNFGERKNCQTISKIRRKAQSQPPCGKQIHPNLWVQASHSWFIIFLQTLHSFHFYPLSSWSCVKIFVPSSLHYNRDGYQDLFFKTIFSLWRISFLWSNKMFA